MYIIEQSINHLRQFPLLKEFVKFAIIGTTSSVINFIIYYSVTAIWDVWYVYSSIWSFVLSAVFNFTMNKVWTFRNHHFGIDEIMRQLSRYLLVMLVGLGVNTGIIYGVTEGLGVDWRLSWVVATGIVAIWNFILNRHWTFRHRH